MLNRMRMKKEQVVEQEGSVAPVPVVIVPAVIVAVAAAIVVAAIVSAVAVIAAIVAAVLHTRAKSERWRGKRQPGSLRRTRS